MLSETWTRALSAYFPRSAASGLLRRRDPGVGFRGAGVHRGKGLRCVLFEFPQRIEVCLLLLQGRQGRFRTADDFTEPAPLLLFRVRDVVVKLLLQFEGFGHVALGFLQRLGEVPDGGIAVLCLGEAEFLLAGVDGVIGLNEQRTALPAEFLDAQRSKRVQFGALGAVAGAGGHGGLLAAVTEVEVRPDTARCNHTGTDQDGSTRAVAGGHVAATTAGRVTDGRSSVDGRLGVVLLARRPGSPRWHSG